MEGNLGNLIVVEGNLGNLVALEGNLGNLVVVEGDLGNLVVLEGNFGNLVVVDGNLLALNILVVGKLAVGNVVDVVDNLVGGTPLGVDPFVIDLLAVSVGYELVSQKVAFPLAVYLTLQQCYHHQTRSALSQMCQTCQECQSVNS